MAYPFDDKTYNRMPYGTPAPFSFGGSILPLLRVQAGDDFGRTSSEFPESTIGYGFGRSASSVPAWQVASSDDPTYPSYPRPGYAPPLPDIFAPWRRYAVPAHEDLWRFLFLRPPHAGSSGSRSEEDCEYLYNNVDSPICRDVTQQYGKEVGQRCGASAMERYAACNAGRQIPPLDWGIHD